jgi:REP element-mobilizing transposase RayT
MPQSLSNCLVHAVWSTKDRYPFLTDRDIRREFHSVIGGISARLGCPTLIVVGVADHVHILMRMSRSITMADWVKETKRASTVWIHERCRKVSRSRAGASEETMSLNESIMAQPMLAKFHWQAGYADFSVSESNVAAVRHYIANQEQHHKKVSFEDEYRRFLEANKLSWDERFLWD